jgi:hypothetical protein
VRDFVTKLLISPPNKNNEILPKRMGFTQIQRNVHKKMEKAMAKNAISPKIKKFDVEMTYKLIHIPTYSKMYSRKIS